MLADDVYRSELTRTFAAMKEVAAGLADVAAVTTAATADHVRLSLVPNSPGACAVELMLRADQYYDIALATEFYEDCRIADLALFPAILKAVAAGHVIQRRAQSALTGAERSVETIVTLADGTLWRKGFAHTAAAGAAEASVWDDKRFLPYRR